MHFTRQPLFRYSLLVGFLCLEGCASSPLVKTPVGWYHDIEGGIVSQPRLPVPGNDQQYPYVGLTPTSPPPLPSAELRQSITNSLSKDRNLSEWYNIADPLKIPVVPASPQREAEAAGKTNTKNTPSAAPLQNSESSSAKLDAAGQDSAPPTPNTPVAKEQPKAKEIKLPQEATGPIVLPELHERIDSQNIVIPAVPVNPPAASQFPGFNIPSDTNLPPPFLPSAVSLDDPKGKLISFPVDSDAPNPKQEKIINDIAWHRAGRTIFVHGYGDANSMDADAQAQAISLALLRAKTVAKLLIAHNVPESSIAIRAFAFGHGVRIRMDE